ncbi:MAG: hypothetical protein QG594_60, partial [Bacteroidota bacterium]|nr:hypothetical protein [Bacteroidota bacterium]
MMKNYNSLIKKIVLFVAVLFFNVSFSQNNSLSGVVTEANGAAIPGVNVSVLNAKYNTSTDMEGKYSFKSLPSGSTTLVVTSIGFQPLKIKVTIEGNVVQNVTLIENQNVLDDVIITGVANPRAKVKSSVSITSMNVSQIEQSAPRSTAEIFRTIPGIRSESSGGEGNSNISVRGVPISSGGSKYLQIQEDGLPVLLFGDIAFATADIFTRFDRNVSRVEAIRGGSASTLASNSPGGIINFISKTGKSEGGSLSTTFGLDYNNFRTDLDFGAKIGDGLYFHAGGFYRAGEGIRKTGATSNNGGQVKFNLTKEFKNGSVTVFAKFLDDKAVAYMPMPVSVSGTNANPTWGNVDGYNATKGALQSPYLSHNVSVGPDGSLVRNAVANGMNPVSKSIGASANFDLNDGWKVSDNFRYSANSGGFISPFPSEVATAATIANSFGENSKLTYANDGTPFNTANGLVSRIHMFDTKLNNLDNFMNDMRITKKISKVGITAGYFKSIQNISTSWLWNSYLQEVSDNNPRLLNVTTATGTLLSDNGLYAYGTPAWGNLARNYDTQYNVSAPYLNVSVDATADLSF